MRSGATRPGSCPKPRQLYRSILEADPRQLDCLHFLGMIALQSGRPEQAVELIGQAIAANDSIAAWHGSIAEAYRTLGRREPAIAHYGKAVALDPKYWAAHNMLADLLRDTGDTAAAIEHYQKAVAAKPDLATARHNLAALLLDQGAPTRRRTRSGGRSPCRTPRLRACCWSRASGTPASCRAIPDSGRS